MGIFSRWFGKKEENNNIRMLGNLSFLEIDMHNHLLPGIDDGSKSVQQSLELIKGLQDLGLSKFICTPHIMEGVHPNTKFTIAKTHAELATGLEAKNSPVEIYAAAEHMIDSGLDDLIKNRNLCVMPGGYVLIEMSYLSEAHALFQTIFDLQSLGYKPILAHPERYFYYHMDFDMYKKIKDVGCLLQLNLLSITRYYGIDVKSTALTLIKSGMYDFVGTDLHHEKHLKTLQHLVTRYDVRELLKTCDILNPTLLDHMNQGRQVEVG